MAGYLYPFRGGPLDGQTRRLRDFPPLPKIEVPAHDPIAVDSPESRAESIAYYYFVYVAEPVPIGHAPNGWVYTFARRK